MSSDSVLMTATPLPRVWPLSLMAAGIVADVTLADPREVLGLLG